MKRVVVIGAGPAGLAALRSLGNHKDKLQYMAYETSDRVGGTWIMDDPYKPTSMYSQLRTNLPKEVMAYQGFPFSSEIHQSYVGHKEVLGYLESFAQNYQLHQHIKFRHSVVKVDPVIGDDGDTQWNVTEKDCQTGCTDTKQFDSVIVCSGLYTEPLLPDIEGQSSYTGEVIHSHNYRTPHTYKDKTVLVLGAGPSGVDIAADLAPHTAKIYLSHNKALYNWCESANIEQVSGIDAIAGDDIILKDKTVVHADVILLATGYRYSFPFLSERCHPVIQDEHIQSIYRMMVDINHPSLYYIGMNKAVVPFPQFTLQSDYAVQCITGQIRQEKKEAMEQEYQKRYDMIVNEFGRLKPFHDLIIHQWEYNNQLAVECHVPMLPHGIEYLTKHSVLARKIDLFRYKNAVYRLSEDQQDFIILDEPFEFPS